MNQEDIKFDLLKGAADSDCIKILDTFEELFKEQSFDIKITINPIYVLIKNGFDDYAISIIEEIEKRNINEKYHQELNLLKKYIKSKSDYKYLTEEQQEMYQLKMNEGRRLFKNQKYPRAITIFREGYDMTKNTEFLYYLGKTFYKLNDYVTAKRFLTRYFNEGFYKIDKANLYLLSMDFKTNPKIYNKSYNDFKRNCNMLKDVTGECIDSKLYIVGKQKQKIKEDVKETINIEAELRNLYQSGKIKEADIILNELINKDNKTIEEKTAINHTMENKKLYLKKAKWV